MRPKYVAPDGSLLVVEQGVLKAFKLDLKRLTVVDEGVAVADGVHAFSVSANGRLAYETTSQTRMQLTWFDRAGQRLATVGRPGAYLAPVLSPDETRVAVGRDGDIWVLDIVRGGETRLIANAAWPVWSPDGREILFARGGNLITKNSSGAGMEEVLLEGDAIPVGWSADGQFVTYSALGPSTFLDLYVLPMVEPRKAQLYLQSRFQEGENQLSPDGKKMAYVSFDSATPEVYVQTFPPSQERWQVSTAGGRQPTWRADGRELFYLGLDGKLMAVDIEMTSHFRAGVPRPLFQVASIFGPVRNSYAPSRSGRRFLVNSYAEPMASTIVVLLKWPAALPN